ncbi:glycosyltransferase, partial [Streptomyces galilaeus]|uniref:glycosyltransferase n=1 Tax=Streptomyces galilaeus TaxID=33899 RepID=UPI0038F5FED4
NGNVNGVDVDYFSPLQIRKEERLALREKLAIAPNDFVFLYVGRLVRDKGVNELVQAFKSLKSSDLDSVDKEYSSVKLLLVGPYEHDLDPLQSET